MLNKYFTSIELLQEQIFERNDNIIIFISNETYKELLRKKLLMTFSKINYLRNTGRCFVIHSSKLEELQKAKQCEDFLSPDNFIVVSNDEMANLFFGEDSIERGRHYEKEKNRME